MEANVLKIERGVAGHGCGRRTVIYFKGCTLHCPSCYSPNLSENPSDMRWNPNTCIFCGICMAYCPSRSIHFENHKLIFDKERCTFCGECVKNCPSRTLHFVTRMMDVEEIMAIIVEDYEAGRCPGGVTISGGEPLFQAKEATEILKRCRELGIPTAVETCLYGNQLAFSKMLRYTDKLTVSIKHYDDRRHVQMTGVSNQKIIENLKYAVSLGTDVKAFIIVNYGENDSVWDASGYADLLTECGVKKAIVKTYTCESLQRYAEIFRIKGVFTDTVVRILDDSDS